MPLVLLSLIAPLPEPVTVMSFQRLVSRLVPCGVERLRAGRRDRVRGGVREQHRSALLSRTPIAVALPPLVTVTPVKRFTPVVPSISMPGCVPNVPVSVTLTFCDRDRRSAAARARAAGDAAAGARRVEVEAVDVTPLASRTTSSLLAVSVGCAPLVPGNRLLAGSGPPPSGSSESGRLSPINRSLASMTNPVLRFVVVLLPSKT